MEIVKALIPIWGSSAPPKHVIVPCVCFMWSSRKLAPIIIDCSYSRCVWALSKEDLVQHMCMQREEQAKKCLFVISESLPQAEFNTMIVTLWAIYTKGSIKHLSLLMLSSRVISHIYSLFENPWWQGQQPALHAQLHGYLLRKTTRRLMSTR